MKNWLLRHSRFHLHRTPTSASRMNLVERWFAELTDRKLRRSTHRFVVELEADIRRWISVGNKDPKPFIWTKTADEILTTLAAYCRRINDSGRQGAYLVVIKGGARELLDPDHRSGSLRCGGGGLRGSCLGSCHNGWRCLARPSAC